MQWQSFIKKNIYILSRDESDGVHFLLHVYLRTTKVEELVTELVHVYNKQDQTVKADKLLKLHQHYIVYHLSQEEQPFMKKTGAVVRCTYYTVYQRNIQCLCVCLSCNLVVTYTKFNHSIWQLRHMHIQNICINIKICMKLAIISEYKINRGICSHSLEIVGLNLTICFHQR